MDESTALATGTFRTLNQDEIWFLAMDVYVEIADMNEPEKRRLLAFLREAAEAHRQNYLLGMSLICPEEMFEEVRDEIQEQDAAWWVDHTPLGARLREDIEYGLYGPGNTVCKVERVSVN